MMFSVLHIRHTVHVYKDATYLLSLLSFHLQGKLKEFDDTAY
jgi:hypothetical protein